MAKTSDKAQPKKIVLTLDMGESKTKAIVQEYPEGKPQVLLMDSEVADVARASVKNIQSEGLPESRAWVGVGGEYYVLGALARYQFRGISQLKELKYELKYPRYVGQFGWLKRNWDWGIMFLFI